MFDFLTGILPAQKLLEIVANKIIEATGKPCDRYEMIYGVREKDLKFKVYNPDGTVTEAGYNEGTQIGALLQAKALNQLPENSEVLYTIIGWDRIDKSNCLMTVHYIENGKTEKLITPY